MKKIVTSESVNIGHPDKTCDTIADAFLDEALSQDPSSQMAVECAIKNDKLFVYGEATTRAKIDYDKIAKDILKDIGYKNEFTIIKEISEQSPDINRAVAKKRLRANDQGICFGYATDETEECMPLPIMVAHYLMMEYERFRRKRSDFFADAKSQVSVEYEDDVPRQIVTIVVSASHSSELSQQQVQRLIKQNVVDKALKKYAKFVRNPKFLINPSGRFTVWGSFGDSGCVGRKIVVDTYGGVGKVGGGCFSSKNATKVDRTGAYYARYVAKNIVANGLAKRCEVELSFAIGVEKPLSLRIECFGTNARPISEIERLVKANFSFALSDMIASLSLDKPIFKQTACYGHFGRKEFPWESVKRIENL